MKNQIAEHINTLGQFCGKRDIPSLTVKQLRSSFGIEQADVMVLFGGSILCGGDVLGEAMINHIAKKYIIVGGAGHTTETLRIQMRRAYPEIEADGLPEARIFDAYLHRCYGLHADYLECASTNCGNNITYLLELLEQKQVPFESILLVQDATMQRRMEAGLQKYVKSGKIINYAAYQAKVIQKGFELAYETEIPGMWELNRYIELLMGEIPRLADNLEGYGPKGKNFIAHVDIPDEVERAFYELKKVYGGRVREANPLYASAIMLR